MKKKDDKQLPPPAPKRSPYEAKFTDITTGLLTYDVYLKKQGIKKPKKDFCW